MLETVEGRRLRPDTEAVVTTAAALGHEVHCATTRVRPPDGEPVWGAVHANPVVDFAARDITDELADYAAAHTSTASTRATSTSRLWPRGSADG
ncbi:hypothetical protein [Actinacidiphila sp. bgisy145]|uniref:hypothetical protein n=1 Tax=Actinacidiphila sp. bgisy145 TaxID=3413792 RepID=UPI003EC0A041